VIHWIDSADDPRLDPYRHVADPAWIRDRHLFVAEGRLVVERLITLGRFTVHSILLNRAAHAAIGEPLSTAGAPVLVCSNSSLLATITGYNFHRGCLALVTRPPLATLADLLTCRCVLALEGVGNPDNIGGLFRTAAALGAQGVLLDERSGDPFYRKAIRTSMGAVLRLPFVRAENWNETLGTFREHGFKVIALTPSASAVDLSEVPPLGADDRVLVMVGAEGPGLNTASLEQADLRVRIPIDGALDSLNVVVAAGIALESLRLQRNNRIDSRCAPGGAQPGKAGDDEHECRGGGDGDRIGGRDLEQQTTCEPSERQRGSNAGRNANQRQHD
jgi:tRNA G18 (ribose-2'-O)-methylase SpoU